MRNGQTEIGLLVIFQDILNRNLDHKRRKRDLLYFLHIEMSEIHMYYSVPIGNGVL